MAGATSLVAALVLAGLLLAGLLSTGCSNKKANRLQPAVPVLVATVVTQPEPLSLRAVGAVEALEAVSVKAQVDGVITEVLFREGQEVREGQVLFQIDPRALRAELEAAEGEVARDSSLLANAEIDASRYADLVQKDYVTKEEYDAAKTQVDVLKSTLQVDRAAVAQARLNLGYASIEAPISGRTGSLLVKKGNVVTASGAALVVINQMRPIRVSFAIPEKQLPLVQKYMTGRNKLEVHVIPSAEGSGSEQKGVLTFLDNAVDASTGTVTLKGEFRNEAGSLLPGQFVDAELVLTVEPNALTVPSSAVVTGQEGTFVFVVGPDKKVEKRMVRVSRSLNNTTVIETGLKQGEVVVTDGQMRLRPGTAVEFRPTGPPEKGRVGGRAPAEATKSTKSTKNTKSTESTKRSTQ